MNERIKVLRKELKKSQEAFGKQLGVTGAGISKIESGERNLTEQMIKAICREFNVDYIWLTTGEGEMFLDLPDSLFDELALEYKLSEEEVNVLRDFVALSKEERAIVMKFLRPTK